MRKIINLVALVTLVSVNVLTPFSYAGLDDFSAQENNTTEIGEPTIVSETNNEVEDENIQEYKRIQDEEEKETDKNWESEGTSSEFHIDSLPIVTLIQN